MPTMILKMFMADAIYIVLTAIIWRLWEKYRNRSGFRILIGIFYGLCSVASTHLAIDYETMLLNVRDIGPLAAGLFFDPISGIIAGLIGGIERFIVGEYFNIGYFTRIACSVSTCLAGFLAAGLHKRFRKTQEMPVLYSFMLGAVMEVFHMYMVFLTHRADIRSAYYVVRTCAIPMIIFTGLGLAVCCLVIRLHTKGAKEVFRIESEKETPVARQFQRWLLAATAVMFLANLALSFEMSSQKAYQSAISEMNLFRAQIRNLYIDADDEEEFLIHLDNQVSDEIAILLVNSNGAVVGGNMSSIYGETPGPSPVFWEHADGKSFETELGDHRFLCTVSILRNWELPQYPEESETARTALSSDKSEGQKSPYLLVLAIDTDTVYDNREMQLYETAFSDLLLLAVLYSVLTTMVEKLVTSRLRSVNHSLHRITEGNLDETVSVHSSVEFSRLSDDINVTVAALRGYIEAAERRMEEELTLAAAIQESALPKVFTFPRKDFEIYALMDPAKQVGGDFYDFFFIDPGIMALVIADVSGKGIPASLFMMRAKTAIKNQAQPGSSPSDILSHVNTVLCEGNDAEMFITVWIGIIDLNTGIMRCANAGHEYPALLRASGEYELLKDKHALALAVMDGIPIREYEIRMNPGDRLFVYTDGVPEAINEKEEQYGTDRLIGKLNTLKSFSQEHILTSLRRDIGNFAGSAEQFDDITMIGFAYNGETRGE